MSSTATPPSAPQQPDPGERRPARHVNEVLRAQHRQAQLLPAPPGLAAQLAGPDVCVLVQPHVAAAPRREERQDAAGRSQGGGVLPAGTKVAEMRMAEPSLRRRRPAPSVVAPRAPLSAAPAASPAPARPPAAAALVRPSAPSLPEIRPWERWER
ncbi:predicted GPI-anchored protein 58 [Panicum virgatum]|uniref:predicted GPI-anchored protein 58 n=1 Tax=Panicum virgatum TaxID=38727 RepID=UPI0019D54EFF|nr:predicted GPI-anchored protein 58 [Panicum virgatum]